MKRSILIAVVMIVALTGWMVSGLFKQEKNDNLGHDGQGNQAMTVEVSNSVAKQYMPMIISQGHTRPNREVTLRAQTAGMIEQLLKQEGQHVQKDDVIAKIEQGARIAALAQAKALVKEHKATFDAVKKIGAQGYSAKTRVHQAEAEYKQAQAKLKQAELDLQYTEIRAPFAGTINHKWVDVGGYLAPGSQVVSIVDNNPLIVSVAIAQQQVSSIKLASQAHVVLATGPKVIATVRFIAPRADEKTRTFRVELAIDNPQNIPSGISVETKIPTKTILAHYLSPSVLVLGIGGELGVMSVDVEGLVHFNPVELISADAHGVWLSGLPNSVSLITRGQGFVDAGQLVRAQHISQLHDISAKLANKSSEAESKA